MLLLTRVVAINSASLAAIGASNNPGISQIGKGAVEIVARQ